MILNMTLKMIAISLNMIVIVGSVKNVRVANQNVKKSVVANASVFVVVIENIGKVVHDFLFLMRNTQRLILYEKEWAFCSKRNTFFIF